MQPFTPPKVTMRTLFIHLGITCLLLPVAFAQAPPAKVIRYAKAMIQRHDTNGDEILQQAEWENLAGTPQAIDLDGDQQITLDELVWYFTQYGRGSTIHRTVVADLSEPWRFDPGRMTHFRPVWQRADAVPAAATETQETPDDTMEEMMRTHEEPIDEEVYQRLLEERQIPASRPYHVLPSNLQGVPAWFIILDKDGDGQVSLAEFAPTLAPAARNLFKRLDKNGNGLIEPNEARNP